MVLLFLYDAKGDSAVTLPKDWHLKCRALPFYELGLPILNVTHGSHMVLCGAKRCRVRQMFTPYTWEMCRLSDFVWRYLSVTCATHRPRKIIVLAPE